MTSVMRLGLMKRKFCSRTLLCILEVTSLEILVEKTRFMLYITKQSPLSALMVLVLKYIPVQIAAYLQLVIRMRPGLFSIHLFYVQSPVSMVILTFPFKIAVSDICCQNCIEFLIYMDCFHRPLHRSKLKLQARGQHLEKNRHCHSGYDQGNQDFQ